MNLRPVWLSLFLVSLFIDPALATASDGLEVTEAIYSPDGGYTFDGSEGVATDYSSDGTYAIDGAYSSEGDYSLASGIGPYSYDFTLEFYVPEPIIMMSVEPTYSSYSTIEPTYSSYSTIEPILTEASSYSVPDQTALAIEGPISTETPTLSESIITAQVYEIPAETAAETDAETSSYAEEEDSALCVDGSYHEEPGQ